MLILLVDDAKAAIGKGVSNLLRKIVNFIDRIGDINNG